MDEMCLRGRASMVIIVTGASHVGKTNLAQMMLEKYHFPYVSQDHIIPRWA